MFLSDMRDMGRKAFPEMQMMMQLFAHFAHVLKQRVNMKDPPFEEAVLPVKLRTYKANLSSLGGYLKPNQLMANYVSKELDKGRIQIPSFTHYIDFPFEHSKGSISPLMRQRFHGPYRQLSIQLRLRCGTPAGPRRNPR